MTALARHTLIELIRLKIFYFLLLFAVIIIGNSAFVERLSFAAQFQMLKDVGLGAMSIFTSLLAMLATATLLPNDIEARTIYTILAKPVPRFEYLLGRLLGMIAMLGIATFVMTVVFLGVLWFREYIEVAAASKQLNGDDLADYVARVQASTFNANLAPGIAIILLKSCILASLTLLISTFATSSIFTMIMAVAVYLIGHLQAIARDYWLGQSAAHFGSHLLISLIALFFPDFQAFNLLDDVVAGAAIAAGIFWQTAALGVVYIVVYFLFAWLIFAGREL